MPGECVKPRRGSRPTRLLRAHLKVLLELQPTASTSSARPQIPDQLDLFGPPKPIRTPVPRRPMKTRKALPFVAEPAAEGPKQIHPNVPPRGCRPDRRLTARLVEQIMRDCFTFPTLLDHRVTEASERIANEVLLATHEIVALYWNDADGNA